MHHARPTQARPSRGGAPPGSPRAWAAVAFARSAGSPFRHPRRDCDCRRSRGVRAGLDRSGRGRNVFGVGRHARGRSVRRCPGAGCGAADGRRRHVGLQQSGRTGIGSQSRGGPHCWPHRNHQPRRRPTAGAGEFTPSRLRAALLVAAVVVGVGGLAMVALFRDNEAGVVRSADRCTLGSKDNDDAGVFLIPRPTPSGRELYSCGRSGAPLLTGGVRSVEPVTAGSVRAASRWLGDPPRTPSWPSAAPPHPVREGSTMDAP